jgi:hypothetical protein
MLESDKAENFGSSLALLGIVTDWLCGFSGVTSIGLAVSVF